MGVSEKREQERIQGIAALLRQAERSLRVLRTLAWGPEVRERFFASAAKELPRVSYETPDTDATFEALAEVHRRLRNRGSSIIDGWLGRQAEVIATTARMLGALGTSGFFAASRELYGAPKDPLADGLSTTLALAEQLDDSISELEGVDLGAPLPACHLAESVADQIRTAVDQQFGELAPKVYVVDELSANALAGPTRIRVRRQACFTDRDVFQLIEHEAFIHVCTALNGRQQKDLPILAASHPGTTRTQEGLAVFAELISGVMDQDRLRRLADRVLAIQMAIDGADFLEVYHYFQGRGLESEQAYESSRRVFRGGVLSGGAPFTKDMVYLGGLLRVHNFLRSAIAAGRADCVRLLFCGKLDLEDLPALGQLTAMGLCRPPRFLPPWASDLRFLVSYLAYSSFLNRVDLRAASARYSTLLDGIPPLDIGPAREDHGA